MLAWSMIVLFVLMQMQLLSWYEGKQIWSGMDYLHYALIQFGLGFLFIAALIIPAYNRIKTLSSTLLKFSLFLLQGIIYSLLFIFLLSLFFEFKMHGTITPEMKGRTMELFFTDLHNIIKTYLIYLAILFAYDYFRDRAQSIIQQKNLENEIDKAKLQSLRAQLQPHFLFNALNGVVALIDENKTKAQAVLINLSSLLRNTVHLNPQKLIPLEEEIELLKKYLSIEQARYEEQLQINWNICPGSKELHLPPLILQPLVENAIKHGFIGQESPLIIELSICDNLIEIKNNGAPLPSGHMPGQGCSIVKKRLQIHFGGHYDFRLFEEEGWVINQISIYDTV